MRTSEAGGKRPLTMRGQHTHDRIVEAAAELMHRDGVRATSLDDVLRHSGAGKSQMYHYFTSKQELLIAVIERQWRLTRAALTMNEGSVSSWRDIQKWLFRVVEIQQSGQAPRRCPLGAVANELAGTDGIVAGRLDKIFSDWAGYLADGLSIMKSRGVLSDSADPDTLALATLASIQGGILLAYTRGDLSPLRAAIDAAYAHLRSQGAETT